MIRALEDDFKKVVGIRQVTYENTMWCYCFLWLAVYFYLWVVSFTNCLLIILDSLFDFLCCSWYLWIFVVIFLLLNVNGMLLHWIITYMLETSVSNVGFFFFFFFCPCLVILIAKKFWSSQFRLLAQTGLELDWKLKG